MVETIVTDRDVSAARAATIWVEAMPDVGVPDEAEFYRWLDTAGNHAVLFRAIIRASKKQRNSGPDMTQEDLGRYITSVVIKEKEGTGKRTHSRPTKTE